MQIIADLTTGRSFGTVKFQYSKYYPVDKTRFIPKDKKLAELMLGSFFCDFLNKQFNRNTSNVKSNDDDSNKQPDVLFQEDGRQIGLQITQVEFTDYEKRKAISFKLNEILAAQIAKIVRLDSPIIVNILPSSEKGMIPLIDIGKGKSKILKELVRFIIRSISDNKMSLAQIGAPIWVPIQNNSIASHFQFIVINPIPKGTFPRFPGGNNIYVNYDQDDVAFNNADIELAVDNIFKRKDGIKSQILLIWSDRFSLATKEKETAECIHNKFINSQFEEVYFMTFENHISVFIKSLQLWTIKQKI